MEKKLPTGRISSSIGMPSPSFQAFLKKIVFDDEAYLVFLENPKGSMASNGIGFAEDVSENMIIEFRFMIDRIRHSLQTSGKKLRFEEIFRLPILKIDGERIKITSATVSPAVRQNIQTEMYTEIAVETAANIYYSETRTEENRGRSTGFDPRTEAVSNKSTESWSSKKFDGSSIFNRNIRERFERTPLISADALKQVIDAVAIKI